MSGVNPPQPNARRRYALANIRLERKFFVVMKKFTFLDIIKGLSFTILSWLFVRWSIQFTVFVITNHEHLALKEWVLSIFLCVICIVIISTVFSKINENKIEKESIRKAYKDLKTDVRRNSIALSYTLGSMPLLWGIGIAILLIGHYKNHHMFYVYFYFFSAGLFPLAYSLLKQIVIDNNGLRLFFGNFFNRQCIILSWNLISSISYATYETSYMSSAGGRIRVPYKVTQQNEGLLINLKAQLPKSSQTLIKEAQSKFFTNAEIELNDEVLRIIIKRPPTGGYKAFLNKIKKYTDVEISVKKENALDRFIFTFAYTAKFIFLSLALLGLYFFR